MFKPCTYSNDLNRAEALFALKHPPGFRNMKLLHLSSNYAMDYAFMIKF